MTLVRFDEAKIHLIQFYIFSVLTSQGSVVTRIRWGGEIHTFTGTILL